MHRSNNHFAKFISNKSLFKQRQESHLTNIIDILIVFYYTNAVPVGSMYFCVCVQVYFTMSA